MSGRLPLDYAQRMELHQIFQQKADETAWGVVYDDMVESWIGQLSDYLKRVRYDSRFRPRTGATPGE